MTFDYHCDIYRFYSFYYIISEETKKKEQQTHYNDKQILIIEIRKKRQPDSTNVTIDVNSQYTS